MRFSPRQALFASALALLGLAACGAPCGAYCEKLLGCAPGNVLSCEDQQTCEERCSEADSEDKTGDFAQGAGCVANPSYSCQDLLNGVCPAPYAAEAQPAVLVCHGVGKNLSFPTYPGSPWPLRMLPNPDTSSMNRFSISIAVNAWAGNGGVRSLTLAPAGMSI